MTCRCKGKKHWTFERTAWREKGLAFAVSESLQLTFAAPSCLNCSATTEAGGAFDHPKPFSTAADLHSSRHLQIMFHSEDTRLTHHTFATWCVSSAPDCFLQRPRCRGPSAAEIAPTSGFDAHVQIGAKLCGQGTEAGKSARSEMTNAALYARKG